MIIVIIDIIVLFEIIAIIVLIEVLKRYAVFLTTFGWTNVLQWLKRLMILVISSVRPCEIYNNLNYRKINPNNSMRTGHSCCFRAGLAHSDWQKTTGCQA